MKQFKVFKNPMGQYEAVKIGWSWPGFFFTWIWAGVKGLWPVFAGILILDIVMAVIGMASPEMMAVSWIVNIGVSIALGSQGNSLRESNLAGRGFKFMETVQAVNPEGATAQHMSNNLNTGG